MKGRNIHILNGDGLRQQLPHDVFGKRVVLRETFIEGPISAIIDEEFWNGRAHYLQSNYQTEAQEYEQGSKLELQQIKQLERNATVNLWFEHDLFCQCNLWFACYLLVEREFTGKAYLVLPINKPNTDMWLGFGSHSETDLKEALTQRIILAPRELKTLGMCWVTYAEGRNEKLKVHLEELERILPFGDDIYKAHIGRLEEPGRPLKSLKEIKELLKTEKFEPAFAEFCKKEGVYGYGDLQVMALWETLNAT